MLQKYTGLCQLLQLAFLGLLLMLFTTPRPVAGLSCPPCNQSYCPNVTTCQYGTVLDACACCSECAKGPGEVCGGIWGAGGSCTNGTKCLVTVPFGSTYSTYLHTNGYCILDQVPVVPTPSPVACPTSTPTSSSVAITPTPTPKTKKKFRCRVPCSRSFCADGKNKFCSANQSGYQLVDERHPCQHTTCRACRIMVEPDCPTCPEPVTKRCLRHFFLCIATHFNSDNAFLELHDPKALTTKGEIMCHIPKLPQPTTVVDGSGSGQG